VNKPSAPREAELIEDIRRQLDLLWGMTPSTDFVRTQCEAMRNEFLMLTAAETGIVRSQGEAMLNEFEMLTGPVIGDPIKPWEVTKKRERLLAIKEAGHALAVAVGRAPQDDEWLPQGKFTVTSGLLKNRSFELGGSTKISTLAELVSYCAATAAEKLELPKARSTPEEDLCALLVWRLCVEDVRMCGSTTMVRSVDEYIKERWDYLSLAFRRVHNQLRKLRGLAPLPRPKQQRKLSLPQTPTRTRRRTEPYYTMTPSFYEFFTGEERTELRWSCRKILEQYGFRPGP
jgi:hypothetical protein